MAGCGNPGFQYVTNPWCFHFPQPRWHCVLAQLVLLLSLLITHPLCLVSPHPAAPHFLVSIQKVPLPLSTNQTNGLDLESPQRHSSGHLSGDATREALLSREDPSWMWVAPSHRLRSWTEWKEKAEVSWAPASIPLHFLPAHRLTSSLTLSPTSVRPFLPSLSCACQAFCRRDWYDNRVNKIEFGARECSL